MKNKKALILANDAWYAYNFRMNLARSLAKAGVKVSFSAPVDNYYSNLIAKEFSFHHIDFDAKGLNILKDFGTIIALLRLYQKLKPNFVFSFSIKPNIYGSAISKITNTKHISNITGLGTIFIKQNIVTKLVKLLYRLFLRFNHQVFFQNNNDRELFIKYRLITATKTTTLPGSGVDLVKFKPMLNQKNKHFKFLLIARLLKDKGIIEFVQAATIVKKQKPLVEFQLLGQLGVMNRTAISKGELNNWQKQSIVHYLGMSEEVETVIAQADCVVLPSYREGLPRSLLEAAAMEKPIIATNVVGCKDVVDDGINGYLCQVKNSKDLANKMLDMLALSSKKRTQMGKAGREKVIKYFDEKIVINHYLKQVET